MSKEIVEWRIRIEGRVQGVGFRAMAQNLARIHHVNGFVRNLTDGTVEICAQGIENDLHSFADVLRRRPGLGSIEQMKISVQRLAEKFSSFLIR
jgi:acylphosphatase